MASKKTRAALVRVLLKEAPASPAPSHDDAEIDSPEAVALAARFQEVRRRGMRTLVELSIELGQVLIEARRTLRGSYHQWLRERLGLEPSTALNYVAMGRLALEAPALVERHKDLGASKLYQVARLEPAARRTVLEQPGIAALNDRAFKKLVDPHRRRERKVTPAMRAQGMHEKLRSYVTVLDGWKPGRLDDERRKRLRGDLRELRRAVDALLARLG